MNKITTFTALLLAPLAALHAAGATTNQEIDRQTLDKWSAPYRDWHYQPGHVIPAQPNIPDHADFKTRMFRPSINCPTSRTNGS